MGTADRLFILCHNLAQLQGFDLSKGQPGNKEMTEVVSCYIDEQGGGIYGLQPTKEAGFMVHN